MSVTDDFATSSLDLNGKVTLQQPTALVWGPDGRLYITEVDGTVKILTVAFGDSVPGDADATTKFYVASAEVLNLVEQIANYDDDGAVSPTPKRQVTGIDVTPRFDANGDPVVIDGKPAVVIYVTSSDNRQGAGTSGADVGLDTNSGVITRIAQTGPGAWDAVDIVRGLARSEENHALNGLEVIQEIDPDTGRLVSERMIVASGGNANTGAPSNNFAGQAEQPTSAALLEVDLDALAAMPVLTDANGRKFVYDLPTLDDPTRSGASDLNDPFGGNDGLNSGLIEPGGPVQIYSPGYRNAFDVEVTEDGRVFTYDNGANNSWGGRPIGEAGDNGGLVDFAQAVGYIATNLNNGEGNANDPINLVQWNPSNKDQLHEATRSDDLDGRTLSAGQGGAQLFTFGDLTYVYGGHPNPTRAEGSRAGLLFSPKGGAQDAFLLVSDADSFGDGGGSDYDEVVAWLASVEANNAAFPSFNIFGAAPGALTSRVLAVTPGVAYDIYKLANGSGVVVPQGGPAPAGGVFLGVSGLPANIADISPWINPIEGDYKEAGRTDGAIDSDVGSVNGLAEYTSTILDEGGVKMSGALIAAQLNGGKLIIMGRDDDGVMQTTVSADGFTIAADRATLFAQGGPLGLATLGDDIAERGLSKAFQGSIWAAVYKGNGPAIQIFQPDNGKVPLAGSPAVDPTDQDGDGVDHLSDPFEFSAENGYALSAGEAININFNPLNTAFPGSFSGTGLLGAALDGATPNQDARTAAENFPVELQRDGLFDDGFNIIPGGNAPIFQIKTVAPGTMVGAANSARDAMHTGVRPGADVAQLVVTLELKNWMAGAAGPQAGQVTGLVFGDGTQSNFLRLVIGAVGPQNAPGVELGFELGDAGYATLGSIAAPALLNPAVTTVQLRLSIDIANGFAVEAAFRPEGQSDFTPLPLGGDGGFSLPDGVLRDVLTGDHVIADGDTALPSGAAIGLVAETTPGAPLTAIDFTDLTIEGFGAPIPTGVVVYRINAGGASVAAIDGGPDWLSDAALTPAGGVVLSGQSSVYTNSLTNQQAEIDLSLVDAAAAPWQLFVHERFDPIETGAAGNTGTLDYSFDVSAGETYAITIYYTENWINIFSSAEGRTFDVTVDGLRPAQFDDLNPLREAIDGLGLPEPSATLTNAQKQPYLGVALSRTFVYTAGDDTLDLSFLHDDPVAGDPKVNAIEIRRISGDQTPPTVQSVSVSQAFDSDSPLTVTVTAADVEGFDLGALLARLDGSELSFAGVEPGSVTLVSVLLGGGDATATLIYSITPPTDTGAWPAVVGEVRFAAGALVDAAGNPAPSFAAAFSITPPGSVDPTAPAGDLDADGISNAVDADVDGDGLANGADPYAYDGSNAGRALAPGETATLAFDAAGTPFQGGLTGALLSPNGAAEEIALQRARVVDGALVVTATTGDHFSAKNTQENALVAAFSSQHGLSVQTRFAAPDFAPATAGVDAPNSFQSAGLVLGLDQDNLVKFVFGRSGLQFQLYEESGGGASDDVLAPVGVAYGQIAEIGLTLSAAVENGAAVARGTATLFGADGQPLPGAGALPIGPIALSGALAQAILSGAPVGAGVIQTSFKGAGGRAEFDVAYQNLTVTGAPAPAVETVEQAFAAAGVETPDAVDPTLVGAAVLTVTAGVQDVQKSSFGAGSFVLSNVGGKKIAAVFVDLRSALYGDAVWDDDGTGGDSAKKDLNFDAGALTAGGLDPSTTGVGDYQEFWFPARDPSEPEPLFADGVAEGPSDGGWRGALLKFSPTANGGFQPGETVTFSGDVDPNSIAGFKKFTVDNNALPEGWDAGGVSGAELIGAEVTILFSDGTTATGRLMGDGSQAGAHTLATQAAPGPAVTLTVNGVEPGGAGTYGVTPPSVILSGPAGTTVRVIATTGVQPVRNTAFDAGEIVDQRLAGSPFEANNALGFQTVDVTIPQSGTIDLTDRFDWLAAPNGYDFPGAFTAPLGFVAAAIDPARGGLPIGPVSDPIYLENVGGPVQAEPAPAPFVIEAESLALSSGMATGVLAPNIGFAWLREAVSGVASGALGQIGDGAYRVAITAYDESDGESFGALTIGGESFAFALDRVLPGQTVGLSATNRVRIDLGTIDLTGGEALSLAITRDAGEFARIDAIEFIPVGDPEPFELELEAFQLAGGFMPGATDPGVGFVWLGAGVSGTAATTLGDVSAGLYRATLVAYDENDGVSTGSVTIGAETFAFALDGDFAGQTNALDAANRVAVDLGELKLAGGESVVVQGLRNLGEFLRIDKIVFTPVEEPTPFGIEAEAMDLELGFVTETDSEGRGLIRSVPGGEGVASTTLGEIPDGRYAIELFVYDESDGASTGAVIIGGEVLPFALDRTFAGQTNAGDVVNRIVLDVGDIDLRGGESVVLMIAPDGGEFGRIDRIAFTPIAELL